MYGLRGSRAEAFRIDKIFLKMGQVIPHPGGEQEYVEKRNWLIHRFSIQIMKSEMSKSKRYGL